MATYRYTEREEPYPSPDLLWSPAQLKARLGEPNLVVLDVRPSHELFSGVIPGAVHFDMYGIGLTTTAAPLWEEFCNLMRSLLGLRGVGNGKTVVLVETRTELRVARLFWLLEYFGVTPVHVLDGGMDAWRAAGFGTVAELAEPHASSFKISPRPELYMSANDLKERLSLGDVQPLDLRTDDEYFGRHKRAARAGAIPGAIHLEWTHFLDEHGRFKPASELAAVFQKAGITKEKAVVPY